MIEILDIGLFWLLAISPSLDNPKQEGPPDEPFSDSCYCFVRGLRGRQVSGVSQGEDSLKRTDSGAHAFTIGEEGKK